MKRLLALLLCIALLLSGCAQAAAPDITQEPASVPAASPEAAPESAADAALEFYGLDDAALLSYMEDAVYSGAVAALSSAISGRPRRGCRSRSAECRRPGWLRRPLRAES